MSEICRSCLQEVPESNFFHIDTFDNAQIAHTIPKDVLQLCIPEMDLYISEQPGICNPCLTQFESFYNFKNKCLATEERILAYVKKNQIGSLNKINLNWVLSDLPQPPLNQEYSQEIARLEKNNEIVLIKRTSDNTISNREEVQIIEDNNVNVNDNDPEKEVLLLSCNTCSYVTMEKEKLLTHKCTTSLPGPADKNKKFPCPHCDYRTTRRYRLSNHINSKHTKAVWYECAQCSYKSTDFGTLKRHEQSIHTNNKLEDVCLLQCPECEFSTISEVTLKKHRVSQHGPILHNCSFCPYQTKDKSNFRKHMYVHGDKPKKCTRCPYQCVSPYQLQNHYKKTH